MKVFFQNRRRFFVLFLDAIIITFSYACSYWLRFTSPFHPESRRILLPTLPTILVIKLIVFYLQGLYKGIWKYASTKDLLAVIRAATISSILCVFGLFVFGFSGLPRSVFIIDWLLIIVLVGGLRLGLRLFREFVPGKENGEGDRVLIYGAGDSGETVLREIGIKRYPRMKVVGFIDDQKNKVGLSIHGVKILGTGRELKRIKEKYRVNEVIIAIPTASGDEMRKIVEYCREAQVKYRTVPGIKELLDGTITLQQIREVRIEDLLRRKPVEINTDTVEKFISGKKILVTGAGGSIGSELCRQIMRFHPKGLILFEREETSLFYIYQEMYRKGVPFLPVIGDVTSRFDLEEIFSVAKPEVVFHSAAYKHVPLLESNLLPALRNNVLGTKLVADISNKYGVEKFILVSTDKAVNPANVMGATKRVAEVYLYQLQNESLTKYVTVRFGNVLDSTGSVVPIMKKQIEEGGPITVTHPEIRRFFMTIPEAAQLILQSAVMGKGGEIFVLDMGEQIRILDLARDLITLSGLVPEIDIPIIFTGLRAGEKMYEELWNEEEEPVRTEHDKIFVARGGDKLAASFLQKQKNWLNGKMEWLEKNIDNLGEVEGKKFLEDLVPTLKRTK